MIWQICVGDQSLVRFWDIRNEVSGWSAIGQLDERIGLWSSVDGEAEYLTTVG
jgi:hypothetical protein